MQCVTDRARCYFFFERGKVQKDRDAAISQSGKIRKQSSPACRLTLASGRGRRRRNRGRTTWPNVDAGSREEGEKRPPEAVEVAQAQRPLELGEAILLAKDSGWLFCFRLEIAGENAASPPGNRRPHPSQVSAAASQPSFLPSPPWKTEIWRGS